ncbi:MAG: DNA polymerase III subunit delta [Nitrosomonadaceae bacterium]|nr:DNA polymerase III subunit delta [Nitrosomonadaceae bacterium]|tara:strand:+ start:2028 stop:3038 length:1011 start_codon:yes stop_codon:yes gene_type:complete
MYIQPENLSQNLKKQLLTFYTVCGDEQLLAIEAADLIRTAAHINGYIKKEIYTIDAQFKKSDMLVRSNSLSLFGEKKLIDIRVPSGKPGKEGSKAIEDYCHSLPSDTLTLVTLPKIDRQGRITKWFKALEKMGPMISVPLIETSKLPNWINQRLNAQNQRTDLDTIKFFAEKVEGNILAADQEIKKLALLYPPGELSFVQIKNAIMEVARYDVFKLSDAMVTGEIARFFHILKGLQGEGIATPFILTILVAQIRSLIIIRKGLDTGRPYAQLMKEAKIWGNRQKLMENAAKRIGLKKLVQALLHAAKIDKISKGIEKGSIWDEIEQLGLHFISKVR